MTLFKDRLKELRLENELTLKELGQKLRYSESTMSMYKSGECHPKTSEDY
ncbi:helix-turn-helix domain-containing protein [Clostridium ganghwense]|uniref:Helix-turn-helix transcriptional regulator n=1 Tax=Clostridium ganghwense TaxID=312089 RepID=A0ABT4CWM9_9CLOT|nr:helix-turn-helix transcriptional regulator [Clostridium ganghwense]MCY6372596.1 helix-turn-helix transcriptional regulator [Clostridium ganghwense]